MSSHTLNNSDLTWLWYCNSCFRATPMTSKAILRHIALYTGSACVVGSLDSTTACKHEHKTAIQSFLVYVHDFAKLVVLRCF